MAVDPVELVRRRAADLHSKVVPNGIDPADLKAVAQAAAAKVGDLEVHGRPRGHSDLRGGRAVYDRDAGTIVYEETGDRFLEAFLIAHEIGHHEFGGETRMVTVEIDPERSADQDTSTSQRVVDYSAQSRTETRMNLFARELLLPRGVLREWHVGDGLSASLIAKKTGAPFGTVALQLFDALLLPQIEFREPANTSRKKLNAEQRTAAEYDGTRALLLRAGPGTGKTQTLVGRLMHLRSQDVDPESLLVLTFSNKAANELIERISTFWPEAAASGWIGTFHAFGLDLLRRCGPLIGLSQHPRLIDQVDAITMLETEYLRLDLQHFRDLWDPTQHLRDILQAISRAKDEVVGAERYGQLAKAMQSRATTEDDRERAERCVEIAAVYECYEKLKRAGGFLDFGDLIALPVRLLEEHEVVRAEMRARYAHVLVDEYQDVNRASVRLLQALKPTGENLWVVGDAKQSVYRFRGASSANLTHFAKVDFPDGVELNLPRNYRSRQEICDAFVEFATNMAAAEDGFQADAARGAGGSASFVPVADKDHEIDELAIRITERRNTGVPLRDQAVICKGNVRLGEIARGLEARGILTLYLGPLFERAEIKQALSLLSLLSDPLAVGLTATANLPECSMEIGDVVRCVNEIREAGVEVPLAWKECVREVEGLTESGRAGVDDVLDLIDGLDVDARPWDAFARIYLDNSRMAVRYAVAMQEGQAAPAIALWQLQSFLRSLNHSPTRDVLQRIRKLVLLADDRDLRALPSAAVKLDAAHLLTVHGSKGLEFVAAYMASMTSGSIPRTAAQAKALPPPDGMVAGDIFDGVQAQIAGHDAEEECLFFVGLSRARDNLVVLAPCKDHDTSPRGQTPFIEKVRSSIQHTRPIANRSAEPTTRPDVSIRWRETPSFSAAQIRQFENCPRHFFYAHVAELPGRRMGTAFTQMHDVVRTSIEHLYGFTEYEVVEADRVQRFDETWERHGPVNHPYASQYRDNGLQLLNVYVEQTRGETYGAVRKKDIRIGGVELTVTANEQVVNGTRGPLARFIHTGRMTTAHPDSYESAIIELAHDGGGRAEFLFLTDERAEPVGMTPRKLATRRGKIENVAGDILAGRFPASPKRPERRCPKCPYFFVCTAVPEGELEKN